MPFYRKECGNIFLINNMETKKLVADIQNVQASEAGEFEVITFGALYDYWSNRNGCWFYRWRQFFKRKSILFYFFDCIVSLIYAKKLKYKYKHFKKINLYTANFNHILPNVLLGCLNNLECHLIAEGSLNYRTRVENKKKQIIKKTLGCLFLSSYRLVNDPLEIPSFYSNKLSIRKLYCRERHGLVTSAGFSRVIEIKSKEEKLCISNPREALIVCQHFIYDIDREILRQLFTFLKEYLDEHEIQKVILKPHPTSGRSRVPVEKEALKSTVVLSEYYLGPLSAEEYIIQSGVSHVLVLGYSTVLDNIVQQGWLEQGLKVACIGLGYLSNIDGLNWAQDFLNRPTFDRRMLFY